jgi:aminopeptidase N
MAALTSSEAQTRAALITVASYEVFLDLTASPVSSRAEIRFRCAEPGAATFADVNTAVVTEAVLNGTVLNGTVLSGTVIASPFDGRLALTDLLAEHVLTVVSGAAIRPDLAAKEAAWTTALASRAGERAAKASGSVVRRA